MNLTLRIMNPRTCMLKTKTNKFTLETLALKGLKTKVEKKMALEDAGNIMGVEEEDDGNKV